MPTEKISSGEASGIKQRGMRGNSGPGMMPKENIGVPSHPSQLVNTFNTTDSKPLKIKTQQMSLGSINIQPVIID